jgi:hypothetical protein
MFAVAELLALGGVLLSVAVLAAAVLGVSAWSASKRRLVELRDAGVALQKRQPGARRPAERRLVVLCWDLVGGAATDAKAAARARRERLVGPGSASEALPRGARFTFYVADELVEFKSWALNFSPVSAPVDAFLSVGGLEAALGADWLAAALDEVVRVVERRGFRCAAYVVDAALYTDYSEYAGPATWGWQPKSGRTWGRGERSPFLLTVTGFPKKASLSTEEFRERWFGTQSPMSEIMQPRNRYIRWPVQAAVSADAPPFAGFAVEGWPSLQHTVQPYLFFNARSMWELAVNIAVMLRSVTGFTALAKVQGRSYGEYIYE